MKAKSVYQRRKIEYIRHIFATCTYAPNYNKPWEHVSKDYNRYIQEYRRFSNCRVEYLRVVEKHENGRPHIHILLQFPDARISVQNTKYFDNRLYARWKALWRHGLSDYQRPYSTRSPVGYILKYITKNATSKTVWKKLIVSDVTVKESESTTNQHVKNMDAPAMTHLHGVKLLTWSRSFDWKPFIINTSTSESLSTPILAQNERITSA
jgi:hypothetical protein